MSAEQVLAQADAQPPLKAAAPPDLVPCLVTVGSSAGMMQDWLLWPVNSTEADLLEFSEGLVRDLGVPPQFRRPVADTIRAQVADWVANVPPLPAGAGPRRELIKLDVVLAGSLRLRDQFWWDLHAASPTPEAFAAELCADSGIASCHGTAVAAAIRIELGKLRRAPPSNLQLPTPRILEAAAQEAAPAGGQAVGSQEQELHNVYDDSCLRMPDEWREWGPTTQELTPKEAEALQKQQQAAAQQLAPAQLSPVQQPAARQDSAGLAPQLLLPPQPQILEQKPAPAAEPDGGGRRQLRARRGRASRLRELLRQEEQDEGGERSSDSDSARAAAGGGGADRASRSVGRAADGGGGSAASPARQAGDESAGRGALWEEGDGEEREAADEARHRTRGSRARQRRRTSGAARLPAAPKQQQPSEQPPPQQQQQQQGAAHVLPTPQQQSMLPIQLHSNGSGGVSLPPGHHGVGFGASGQFAPMMAGSMLGGALGGAGLVAGGMPGPAGLAPLVGQQQQAAMLPGMVPTPGGPGGALPAPQAMLPPAGLGQAPAAGVAPSQQARMVAAALCHYARELSMGEDKIRAMLSRPPADQLAFFRTLHQLVQEARARQQEQLEAAAAAAQAAPGGGLGLPAMPAPAHAALPPMPLPMAPQQQELAPQQQPQSQFANLFSEMFD